LSLATGVPFRTRKSPLRQRAFVKFCQIGKKQLFQPVRRRRYSGETQGLAIFDGASNTIEGVCVDGIQLQRHPGTRSYFLREVDQWHTSTLAHRDFFKQRSFPKSFDHRPASDGFVILSHWDFDHFDSASQL
jgi:hypothetical protein